MKCLLADREGLTAYLRFPAEHHHRIRHSNFIERTFGETRRRTKVIGRLPGGTSCLTLVWAVLDRASRGWRGLAMTADGLRLLQDLRRSLLDPPRQLRPRTVTATGTTTAPRMSAPSPNITMNRNRARPFYTGFRTPPALPEAHDRQRMVLDHLPTPTDLEVCVSHHLAAGRTSHCRVVHRLSLRFLPTR